MKRGTSRREFLKAGALAGAGILILRSGMLQAGESPNGKLNVACIGVGGRGGDDMGAVAGENIVALCDVNEATLAPAAKRFPNAKTYADWRKCLDQKDIDAVVCATTDQTHAFINTWALNRGKSVYCEKPIANSVHEARTVREAYLKNKDKVATQMGTQIHAEDNFRRVVELIRAGVIGTVKSAHVWCSRMPEGGNYFPAEGTPPPTLNWDLWIGPAPEHPYNPKYFGGCLAWNRFWDFGSGQIGDMGSHLMDLAYWALDLRFPTSCEAQGTPVSTDTCPQWLTAKWEHPKNDWRPPVEVTWSDGGKKPGMPSEIFNRDKMFQGNLFAGEKGYLVADYGYRAVLLRGDMTQYKAPKPEDLIPPSKGHHKEWIEAAKGDKKTLCNFDYSGALIEHNLLALVAYRTGKKLEWDAEKLKATNCPEADAFITKKYRTGWTLNG